MGEIAEMMLEGFLDEETGEVIDGDAPGFPRRMSDPNCYYRDRPPSKKPLTDSQCAARSARKKRQRANKKARAAKEQT